MRHYQEIIWLYIDIWIYIHGIAEFGVRLYQIDGLGFNLFGDYDHGLSNWGQVLCTFKP